jgi:hypothetical protein
MCVYEGEKKDRICIDAMFQRSIADALHSGVSKVAREVRLKHRSDINERCTCAGLPNPHLDRGPLALKAVSEEVCLQCQEPAS